MSQQRQFQIAGENYFPGLNNDTTFTKIFVGGLAWETQRDTMRRYFEQFGEILEAVVITDKNTGRSKGYGFVTFKEPEAAMRACQNPSPVIDGRRANCNLASFGAQKNRPTTSQHGPGRFRASSVYHGASSSTYIPQPASQYPVPYSSYGYPRYSQEPIYPLSYYSLYGGQHVSPYYPTGASSAAHGIFHGFYPFYAQYAQSSQAQGFGVQYPQMFQYPYLPPHQFNSSGILSIPSSAPMPATSSVRNAPGAVTPTPAIAATNVPSAMVTAAAAATTTRTTARQDVSAPPSAASAEKSSSS